jgi:hypothetical protein
VTLRRGRRAPTSSEEDPAPGSALPDQKEEHLPTHPRRRRRAAAPIVALTLALGTGAPALAAPSTGPVAAQAAPSAASVEVPIVEDPAERAAGQAAELAARHAAPSAAQGRAMPVFLAVAVVCALLALGLCVVAALRA